MKGSRLRAIVLIVGLSANLASCGQHPIAVDYSNDSLRIVEAEWRVDEREGFRLLRYHFGKGSLFCSAQYLSVIEVPAGSPLKLAMAYDSARITVDSFAVRHQAVAAINGSFFDVDKGNPVCYLRVDSVRVGENTPSAADSIHRKYYQYAALLVDSSLHDRPMLIVPDSSRTAEDSIIGSNLMTAGPMLLYEGSYVPQRDDLTFVSKRHARTALGIREDGSVVMIVVDGYLRGVADGMSLMELQRVMRWLGCRSAINLDGGGSSTMYVPQATDNGIVNHPADNWRFDHEGARPVSNALLLR